MTDRPSFGDSVQNAAAQGARLLLPLVDSLLPRVASMSQQALFTDPVQWTRTILQTTDLVGGDAIAVCVDPDMTLVGCGARLVWEEGSKHCEETITLTDTLDKTAIDPYLQMVEGVVKSPLRNKSCAVALLGPATLALRIFNETPSKTHFNAVKSHLTALAEIICQQRPELLMFLEDESALAQTPLADLRRIYSTLSNVARYYDVGTGILTEAITPEQAAALAKLKLDALMVCGHMDVDAMSGLLDAAGDWSLLGLSLPLNDSDQLRSVLTALDTRFAAHIGLFYLTPGQLPQDSDLESLRDVKKAFSAATC
ncbi:MAG TPA: hypothetical protein DD979_08635 [Gammaproteobacteria bacterium]|jgi:hypothetical protein|nr:hypothetical protein [Gammaproteobacteria bacterium]